MKWNEGQFKINDCYCYLTNALYTDKVEKHKNVSPHLHFGLLSFHPLLQKQMQIKPKEALISSGISISVQFPCFVVVYHPIQFNSIHVPLPTQYSKSETPRDILKSCNAIPWDVIQCPMKQVECVYEWVSERRKHFPTSTNVQYHTTATV